MSAHYDLYVITDEGLSEGLSHQEIARRAIAGGADVIQLRDKAMTARQLLPIAKEINELARRSDVLFIVNDRIDVALASGAHGVHLGQDDLPLIDARRITPPGFIIGISASSKEQAIQADLEGADYVALGPIFTTNSKKDAAKACGIEKLHEVSALISVPLLAIGGINNENVVDVIDAGADGIAVISAVVSQPDVTNSARELKGLIVKAKGSIT
jgi:thiamine-phosphate pyrophosphorylase